MTTGRINQVTASVLTGPGGPHRRASVARGHDAVLSLRYRSERFPERTAPASLPCSLGPGNGTIRLDLLRLLVKLLRKITCKHDAVLSRAPPREEGSLAPRGGRLCTTTTESPAERAFKLPSIARFHDAELSRALPRGEGPMAPRTGPAMHHHHRIAR